MLKHKLNTDLRETVCGVPVAGLRVHQIAGPDRQDPVTCSACTTRMRAATLTVEQRLAAIVVLSNGDTAILGHAQALLRAAQDADMARLHC